jgi:hypothetical protein
VWKIWERGAPDLGVEIVSTADEGEPDWDEKLVRYRAAGVGEVVRFDAEDGETPLRVWDMISGDLVERSQDDPDLRRCEALDLWWVIVKDEDIGPMLRLARDREGRDRVPTPEEQAAKAHEESTKAREESAKAREENERIQIEMTALRAQLESARAPKTRKRRS